jgi:hypothetical protein
VQERRHDANIARRGSGSSWGQGVRKRNAVRFVTDGVLTIISEADGGLGSSSALDPKGAACGKERRCISLPISGDAVWRCLVLFDPFAEPLETTNPTRIWIRSPTASWVRWGLGGDPHFSVRSANTRTDRATLLDISK